MSKYMAYVVVQKVVNTGEIEAPTEDAALAKARIIAKDQGYDDSIVGVLHEVEEEG